MEIIITCSLAILEMTFVLVALFLLHGLRKVIGSVAFYIALGFLLIFIQLVNATELKVVLGYPGLDFFVSSTVLFLPYLTALMIIYITEGTLATQRVIIGAIATLGFYLYLSHLTVAQCDWTGYTISQGPSADSLDYLLRQSQRTMAGTILAQSLDLFLIPIFFQRLRNLGCRIFFCVLGALMLTQFVDTFVYVSACYWGEPRWQLYMYSSYISKVIATIWLSILATIYLNRIEKEIPGEGKRAMDIVFAFFGGYSKAQALEESVKEWEGRYKLLVENASDLILLLDQKGIIINSNFKAVHMLQCESIDQVEGKRFSEMIRDNEGNCILWDEFRKSFISNETVNGVQHIDRLQCLCFNKNQNKIELDIALSTIDVRGEQMIIVLGRDVTEENRLSREKEELREQLIHTQRLESVGKLAGGVAHDFNNYLHALQGHLDIITYMHEIEDEGVTRHLKKIDYITEQASLLTKQLLGFARKGKYNEQVLDLCDLVEQSVALFMPNSLEGIDFTLDLRAKSEMLIKGDKIQLQQVFLNLLINSKDAMEANSKGMKLTLTLCELVKINDVKWNQPTDYNKPLSDYYCISLEDNGMGIDKITLSQIFDPFFTTKPFGKGTGMGLAMAYGTISNHHGWIQVQSKEGEGAIFYILLPKI